MAAATPSWSRSGPPPHRAPARGRRRAPARQRPRPLPARAPAAPRGERGEGESGEGLSQGRAHGSTAPRATLARAGRRRRRRCRLRLRQFNPSVAGCGDGRTVSRYFSWAPPRPPPRHCSLARPADRLPSAGSLRVFRLSLRPDPNPPQFLISDPLKSPTLAAGGAGGRAIRQAAERQAMGVPAAP